MYDDLFKIEDTMGRSKAIMRRMYRKVKTDKYLWVCIGLMVLGVGAVVLIKVMGWGFDGDDEDDQEQ
jgi:hypothetical protein